MTFDPNAHMIQLRGKGGMTDYLPVAARIAWFRERHPDGHIAIEAHTITEQIAIFHARVSVPDAGSAEGWGSETPRDFGDFIEKASTKALGRALLALGFGTMQAGDELNEGERIADAPVERPKPSKQPDPLATFDPRRPQDRKPAPPTLDTDQVLTILSEMDDSKEPWHEIKRYADDQSAGRAGDEVLRIHDKLRAIASGRKSMAPAGVAG
jgi:hypothetical protein